MGHGIKRHSSQKQTEIAPSVDGRAGLRHSAFGLSVSGATSPLIA
jgi:hypothetical protein